MRSPALLRPLRRARDSIPPGHAAAAPAGDRRPASERGPRPVRWLPAFAVALLALPSLFAQPAIGARSGAAAAWQRYLAQSEGILSSLNRPDAAGLPAPPPGVNDLSFAEFFGPIGDRGREYSAKLRALDGQPVRLAGYMIREQERTPGLFRFAAWPLTVDTTGPCSADNSPPSAVHVFVSSSAARLVPYRPGRLVLIGRIEIGPRPEADGRNSTVRLILDASSAAPVAAGTDSSEP